MGLHDAAEIADKIDKHLEKIYPDRSPTSPAWRIDRMSHNLYVGDVPDVNEMRSIIHNNYYCTACAYTTEDMMSCCGCRFRQRGEELYYDFCDLFPHSSDVIM